MFTSQDQGLIIRIYGWLWSVIAIISKLPLCLLSAANSESKQRKKKKEKKRNQTAAN